MRKVFIFLLIFAWIFSGRLQIWQNPQIPPKIEKARATVASVYIARAGTTGLITNLDDTENTLTYDIEVQASNDITRQTGNQAFRIQNSGRYLIIANTRFNYADIGNNNRHVVRTSIKVGGTVLPNIYGMASGYGRDSGSADEDGVVVVAYIDHTVSGDSADDITVHVQNFGDAASDDTADQLSDESGIQIIRLPDDDEYLKVSRTSDITLSGTMDFSANDPTWNEFGWETQDAETDTSIIEWVSGNDITLKSAGHYLVIYSVHQDATGDGREGAVYRLKLDDVEIPATRVLTYARNSNGADDAWVQWAGIIEASANDVLNIDWGSACESACTSVVSDAAITVVKMPDTASYVRVYHNANRAGETTGVYPMDAESEDDEGIHDTVSNTGRINGTSDSYDWLLFGSWFARTVTADSTRVSEHFRWSRTGTIQGFGSGLSYHRGDQSSTGVPASGRNAAIVATDLSSSEWMALDLRHESGTGSQNRDFIANTVGITGVALDTLAAAGTITTDIVDESYNPVSSPTMAMNAAAFSFTCQTVTGTFGTVSERIYVNNDGGADNGWTLTLAAQATTNVWDSAGTDYDFNDPGGSGCTDGGDADSVGGRMTVDPSVGTLTVGQCSSCSTNNISKGSSAAYSEGAVDSITLLSATADSDNVGDWVLTGVSISQKIPAEQPAASDYNINMVLTVTAN